MAYARFGEESDIHIMGDTHGSWVCFDCLLAEPGAKDAYLETLEQLDGHVTAHMEAGHKVPVDTVKRINREKKLYGKDFTNPVVHQKTKLAYKLVYTRRIIRGKNG